MNTVTAPDLLKPGQYPYLQNSRKLLGGRMVARPPLGPSLIDPAIGAGVTSLTRLNDPYLPGYALIIGAAGSMYVNSTSVASGLSGKPICFLPYRPSQSPRAFCYTSDPSLTVTIPAYISSGYGTVAGMLKVRADGMVQKSGVKEPQAAPIVGTGTGNGANWVSYRVKYRSKVTGARSNPSPASEPKIIPQDTASGSEVAATGGVINPNIIVNGSQYEPNGAQIRTKGGVNIGVVTDYVIAHNFGFAIPTGVTVDGVLAAVNWEGQYAGTGILSSVALFYQGQIIGQSKAPGIANTQTPSTSTQGGAGDAWGTVLTPAIINDSTFGIGFQVTTQSSGGSDRSFFNNFTATIYFTTLAATVTATPSLDPQVDTIDYYRQTAALANFTYSGSTPNTSVGFNDTQSDLAIANNPILTYDDYEPFPSIDLPRSGTCNVTTTPQQVSGITILTPGSAQTNGTYIIASTGGGGTGATVQIVIAGGIITSAVILTNGAGYTTIPTFTVAHGGTPGTLAATIGAVTPGTLNVTSVTGDPFNVRWLPGNIININGINYLLYNRPSSTTQLCAVTITTSNTGFITYGYPPAGTGLTWSITVPALAAEPSPVIWGPTPDNAGSFYFGLDPNNQGDLLWSLGNNFDSAPQTNRLYVTSPNEPLMNGTVTSQLSTVFSTDRFWLIYPNFADAVAAVTGTLGSQWVLIQAASTRGLYMRYAIAALGTMTAWRAKDGIFLAQGGGAEQDISTNIYNLFPHGQPTAPGPVTIGGNTVYPPDDTKPDAQTMAFVPGYVFYNYQDTTGTQRTLVYDMEAKGWTVDAYTPRVNYHTWAAGDVYQILVGCTDGTVRQFDAAGTEAQTAIVSTPCSNGGSARSVKRLGGVFLRAQATTAITPTFWSNRYATQITGFTSAVGPAAGEQDYLIDFTAATGADVYDLAASFSFAVGSGDWLKEWQTDWTEIPEAIAAWRTGMLTYGLNGWLHIPWLRFAYQSSADITLKLITDQGATTTITVPSSGGAPAKFFSWVPATIGGKSMKFRMIEWVADAGGAPFTVFGADNEVAVKEWGSTGPYQTLKPFRQKDTATT